MRPLSAKHRLWLSIRCLRLSWHFFQGASVFISRLQSPSAVIFELGFHPHSQLEWMSVLTSGSLTFTDCRVGPMARASGLSFSLSLRGGSRENHVTDLPGTQTLTLVCPVGSVPIELLAHPRFHKAVVSVPVYFSVMWPLVR